MAKRTKWDGRRRPYNRCACGLTTWFVLGSGPYSAIIDAEDADRIGHWNWHADVEPHTVYARRNEGGKTIALHRAILDAPTGLDVDHRNGCGLDNRKSNLRTATSSENRANARRLMSNNKTGLKGVSFNRREGKYKAYIGERHIGTFVSAEEAAAAYDRAAVAAYGEFAATNEQLGLTSIRRAV